jgi:UDP-2,3-diacylglucosamine pyrophosphatase LpxH
MNTAGVSQPHRTVFVSDVHLGSRHCHAAELARFLGGLRCERLYLVGDIVDLWWMAKRRASWHHAHNAVVEALDRQRPARPPIGYNPVT